MNCNQMCFVAAGRSLSVSFAATTSHIILIAEYISFHSLLFPNSLRRMHGPTSLYMAIMFDEFLLVSHQLDDMQSHWSTLKAQHFCDDSFVLRQQRRLVYCQILSRCNSVIAKLRQFVTTKWVYVFGYCSTKYQNSRIRISNSSSVVRHHTFY